MQNREVEKLKSWDAARRVVPRIHRHLPNQLSQINPLDRPIEAARSCQLPPTLNLACETTVKSEPQNIEYRMSKCGIAALSHY